MARYRIRKLTPKECWVLQGMTQSDCDKVIAVGVSPTNLYKIAGNGIPTNCINLLFQHLFQAQYDDSFVTTDEEYSHKEQGEGGVNGISISYCVDANYWKGGNDACLRVFAEKKRRQLAIVSDQRPVEDHKVEQPST